jgi:hypothetical protein
MTSAERIDELLALSEKKLAGLEASVARLERRMDLHEERLDDLEEILGEFARLGKWAKKKIKENA